jgi:hypothetical protein
MPKPFRVAFAVAVAVALTAAPSFVRAQSSAGCLVLTNEGIAGGMSGASGILTFRGHSYPFTMSGIALPDRSASGAPWHGTVSGLARLADFSGSYSVMAGADAGGSPPAAGSLQNRAGVLIHLDTVRGPGPRLVGSSVTVALAH